MKTVGKFLLAAIGLLVLTACAQAPQQATPDDVTRLSQEIATLGPRVDPVEAEQAANLAYAYSLQLREDYNVTAGPIIHNAQVNNGLRDRGLCVHWAEDLEARMNEEGFKTLQIHRAIAEGNEMRIDHSTAIISARGNGMNEGIVLDPWRFGGHLYWAPTLEDSKYFWEPQLEVLERKYQRRLAEEADLFAN